MIKLRVMTLNLGGGVKNYSGSSEDLAGKTEAINRLIAQVHPDVLAVQEIAQHIDAEGNLDSMVDRIRMAARFDHAFYGETLSMKRHMQVKKDLMINGLFNDWWDWSKGNALFSRIPFSRLGDESKEGVPRNIPIFQPLVYEGTRDTDPRNVILSRLKVAPFPYLLNLHLTTLTGERGKGAWADSIEQAKLTRAQQMERIIGLLETHVLMKELPIIMMGDFNANPDEYTLRDLLEKERGFTRLIPENPIHTHAGAGAVDHIYFSPAGMLKSYQCQVIDSDLSHRVSDHLPVVAEIILEE